MLLLSISSQWTEVQVHIIVPPAPLHPLMSISHSTCQALGACHNPCRFLHDPSRGAHAHRSQLPCGHSWSSLASGEAPGASCSTSLPWWCCSTTRRSVLGKVAAQHSAATQQRTRNNRRKVTKETSRWKCDPTSAACNKSPPESRDVAELQSGANLLQSQIKSDTRR